MLAGPLTPVKRESGKHMHYFDSHAHFEDAQFAPDRFAVLDDLFARGVVQGIVNSCSDMGVVPTVVELASRYERVWATVGVHPHWCLEAGEGYLDVLREAAGNPKIVAIGEIGLDYFWDEPRDVQLRVFEEQLDLARALDLPVVIHDRDAHGDTVAVLQNARPCGVVHRYAGDVASLEKILQLGVYVSFGGDMTYPQWSAAPLAALRATPPERILIETDCPYAPPRDHENERCDPSMLGPAVAIIAREKGISEAEVIALTAANARAAYGIRG